MDMPDHVPILDLEQPLKMVGLLILPGASRLDVCLLSEAFFFANSMMYVPQYQIQVMDMDGRHGDITRNNEHCEQFTADVSERFSAMFVFGGAESFHHMSPSDRQLIRHLSRISERMGSVGHGAFTLAELGFFDATTVSLHSDVISPFQERFPTLSTTQELFFVDDRRFSCCGGTATIDLALYIIANDCGNDCAGYVADAFVHDRAYPRNVPQRTHTRDWLALADSRLAKAVDLMRHHLEDPLTIDELATSVQLNQRSLQRLFRRHLNCSPTNYYLQLRMWQARQLVLETALSVTEVGIACGFVSSSHFSVCYRNFFGKSPTDERKNRSVFSIVPDFVG
jgi:AraC family transcriptional regulator, glycine betaine-responsive activator